MSKEFTWFKWYTPKVRISCHLLFWLLITLLYYLNYSRLGASNYIWWFVGKDLLVTGSLFYSASFVIAKWVSKGNVYPLLIFFVLAYLWWISWTYIACYFSQSHVPETDKRLYNYTVFFLTDGFLKIFTINKFAVLAFDFIFIVFIPLAPKLTKAIMESSLKMVKLERDNISLELDFLKSQISPHFLFNTLNSIYRMSETNDPLTAETVLRLSNLVRYILYQAKDEKILLSKEIGFIKDYINLGMLRFGGNVPIKSEIMENDEPFKIVPLILIPFVENAFKHGPDRSRDNAWIDISLTIIDEKLKLIVKNGVNHSAKETMLSGFGLENVRKRLNLHYPGRHCLINDPGENSFSINLTIDLK